MLILYSLTELLLQQFDFIVKLKGSAITSEHSGLSELLGNEYTTGAIFQKRPANKFMRIGEGS